jgi:hypothetical protein
MGWFSHLTAHREHTSLLELGNWNQDIDTEPSRPESPLIQLEPTESQPWFRRWSRESNLCVQQSLLLTTCRLHNRLTNRGVLRCLFALVVFLAGFTSAM